MGGTRAQDPESGQARRRIAARGLPYFGVYTDLVRHPKTRQLARLVGGAPLAWGYLVALWTFTTEFYADGRVPNRATAIEDLERLAEWPGEPGALVKALVKAGFLDRSAHYLTVHDWHEYQAVHVARREEARAKKREQRADARGSEGKAQVNGLDAGSKRPSKGVEEASKRPSKGVEETEMVENPPEAQASCPGDRPQQSNPSQSKPIQSKPASHSDRRSSTADDPAAGWPEGVGEQGEDPGLQRFRAALAARLGMPTIGVGKDRLGTIAAFNRYIRAWGQEQALAECARIAAESKNGTPANLAWWVGWLNTVPESRP